MPPPDSTMKELINKIRKNIEDADFERAVNEIIDSEDFFPSISKIKKYCKGNISYDTAGRELKIL